MAYLHGAEVGVDVGGVGRAELRIPLPLLVVVDHDHHRRRRRRSWLLGLGGVGGGPLAAPGRRLRLEHHGVVVGQRGELAERDALALGGDGHGGDGGRALGGGAGEAGLRRRGVLLAGHLDALRGCSLLLRARRRGEAGGGGADAEVEAEAEEGLGSWRLISSRCANRNGREGDEIRREFELEGSHFLRLGIWKFGGGGFQVWGRERFWGNFSVFGADLENSKRLEVVEEGAREREAAAGGGWGRGNYF